MPHASASQDAGIDRLIERLYEVISFEEGGEPDWQGLTEIFSPHARITRITPEGVDYFDRDGFLAMTRNMFDMGAFTSFFEFELAREVQRFGGTAQVWSLYETRRNRRARGALNRGVNSIQLVRDGDAWRVLALLWDETHAHAQLEARAVFQEGAIHA